MPYDQEIEDRIQKCIREWENAEHKKMFGGICHLIQGNMFGGVYQSSLILRLGVDGADEVWNHPHVRPFDITGRPMKGWIMVEKAGFESDEELSRWLERAKAFALTLPPK